MSADVALSSSLSPKLPQLPKLSVVIPIYNGAIDIPDLLTCLQQQSYPSDRVEYLLVDNNSSDNTLELLQAAKLPNLRLLQETAIQSAYAARNTGIRAATGEILVFTDADCRPQPDWLLHLVKPFATNAANAANNLGIVAGEITALPGKNWLERYADRQATLSQTHTLAHAFYPYGQTANLAVRRETLEQVGLFRPYLTTGGDADLCWRIVQQGWQIQLAETAVVQHRHRATLTELRSQWQRYGRSNRYLHELHGVSLAKSLSQRDLLHRWSRWLLKEVPTAFIKVNVYKTGISGWIDAIVDTPLNLFCQHARVQGQSQAKLPEAARDIAWFSSPEPSVSSATSLALLNQS